MIAILPPAPVKIDADLYGDFASPARIHNYPREHRCFIRIDISLRNYWHTLFDTCPRLLDISGPDGSAIFIPFMAWAEEKKLSFSWTFFLWVYRWLRQSEFRDQLDDELLMSMMSAAALRWLALDRDIDYCGVVIAHPEVEGAISGWKLRSIYTTLAQGDSQVEHLTFDGAVPQPEDDFGYFLVPKYELDYFPGWQSIPK